MATRHVTHPDATRIIICCDGTGNSEYLGIERSPQTNVSRISRYITPHRAASGGRQLVHYLPGIGTAADNSASSNLWNKMIGEGLDRAIQEAYSFLCHNFDQGAGDEIILIGFSRGAFAVRCIVDLIQQAGLLTKAGLFQLLDIYARWKENQTLPALAADHQRRGVRIKVCAVWDTVSSMGFQWPGWLRYSNPPGSPNFVHSELSECIDNAFQALSLHEQRYHFYPIVWQFSPRSHRLEQCWFMGYHSDIGGGNETESLAHFALAWMISKLLEFVDFDFTNYWQPEPTLSSWRLGLPKLKLMDPFNHWPYKVLGSTYRKPRCQFWNIQGRRETAPNEDISRERMHCTVRFLKDEQPFEQPMSLRGRLYNNPSPPTNRLWNLLFIGNGPSVPYTVEEATFDPIEKELLEKWLRIEWALLPAGAGNPLPLSIIASLQAWLSSQ